MAAVEVLLISGLHANETCAPPMAEDVHRRLGRLKDRVALFHIPPTYTLLGLLDDPATAVTDYSAPAGQQRLDMDLDDLDDDLRRRFPGALHFEFHNVDDSAAILGIDPGKPPRDYEVGTVGPVFVMPYEIGTWRNVDPDGRPGKYLIEMPAAFHAVPPTRLSRREHRLEEFLARGYRFEPAWRSYLSRAADVEQSRRRGYLEGCLAQKVADWILGQREASRGVT